MSRPRENLLLPADGSQVFSQMMDQGYAVVRLSPRQVDIARKAYRQSAYFFDLSIEEKKACSTPDFVQGYRPPGHSSGANPDILDQNEAFLYWPNRPPLRLNPARGLYRSLACYQRELVRPIVGRFISEVCEYYDCEPFGCDQRSLIQVNSFGELSGGTEDAVLQGFHEDGTMVTFLQANAPGLWIVEGDERRPISFRPDKAILMAGSVLTAMSGGAVAPCMHEVRGGGVRGRLSLASFINPDLGPGIALADSASVSDVEEVIKRGPETFGLSEDFYMA